MIFEKKMKIPKQTTDVIIPDAAAELLKKTGKGHILVHAMSGFGKTSVAASLASAAVEKGKKVGWYRMDILDNEPERMLSGLKAAWEYAGMESDGGSDGSFFVCDALEELTSEKALKYLLVWAEERNEKNSFFFMTNGQIPGIFTERIMREEVRLLTEDAFRLREGYSKVLLDAFCGWSFGLKCASEYPEEIKRRNWHAVLRETGLSGVLDRILWDRLSENVRRVITHIAHLDEFSWELCKAIMEERISRRDFEEMIALKGICEPVHPGEWYRFGEAFSVYLGQRLPETERCMLYGRAAEWYREYGDYARMTDYAIRGEQTSMLMRVLEKSGAGLLTGRIALGRILSYLGKKSLHFPAEAAGIAAQYYYSEGDFRRAEHYLNEADSQFGRENKYSSYRSLYRALFHFEEDREKYEKQILEAIFFLRENDLPFPVLRDVDVERLQMLRAKAAGGGEMLRVNSFGTFRVVVKKDDHELSWRTRKGRELFAYLLDIKGEAVDRKKLIETLWPEEIPENAVAMLHNMIYHIRKELSEYRLERILIFENKRYRLSMEEISCDSVLYAKLAEYVEKKDMEELIKNQQKFLDYPGRYLEDVDNLWAEEKREYYDKIYRMGCELLAEHYIENGDREKAAALYGNILHIDPYSESAVKKMLQLYGEGREWKRLKKCYEDFEALLKRDLKLEPGEEVREAYRLALGEQD